MTFLFSDGSPTLWCTKLWSGTTHATPFSHYNVRSDVCSCAYFKPTMTKIVSSHRPDIQCNRVAESHVTKICWTDPCYQICNLLLLLTARLLTKLCRCYKVTDWAVQVLPSCCLSCAGAAKLLTQWLSYTGATMLLKWIMQVLQSC